MTMHKQLQAPSVGTKDCGALQQKMLEGSRACCHQHQQKQQHLRMVKTCRLLFVAAATRKAPCASAHDTLMTGSVTWRPCASSRSRSRGCVCSVSWPPSLPCIQIVTWQS